MCVMKKELTNKSEMKLMGLSARTNNNNEMNPLTAKIGELFWRYSNKYIANLMHERKNFGTIIAAYTNYESNEHGDYTYFVGEEVTSLENIPSGLESLIIPACQYQKFTTPAGKMPAIVIDAWQMIWKMPPNELGGQRLYQTDFEIYDQRAINPNSASVDIYIGIK